MICNARLNLVILHPFPSPQPAALSRQEPNGLSTQRCHRVKNIHLQKKGEERGKERSETEKQTVTKCHPNVTNLHSSRGRGHCGLVAPQLQPFVNLYLLALYSHLSVSKQNMSHASTGYGEKTIQTSKTVKSLKRGEQTRGHTGNSLNNWNLH